MKTMLAILFVCITLMDIEQTKSEIENLFTPQNSVNIPNYFNKIVDLDIPTARGTYDAEQAKIIFNKFLKENNLESYIKKHSGGGNGRSKFEIGNLKINKEPYRTYVLYNFPDEKVEIIELRIEKE